MVDRPATRALGESNWKPNRRVDIEKDLVALVRDGYVQTPVVIEFLREYSGLTIGIEHNNRACEIWFSASRACELIAPEWVEEYVLRASVRLVPVGAAYRDHLTLLIGADDSWYGGYDDEFGLMARDIFGLIDNLIENKGFVECL